MEQKPTTFKEIVETSTRDFSKPYTYYCLYIDKEKGTDPIGMIPFASFSKLDTMILFKALANNQGIDTENISFVCVENTNILYTATAENDKIMLKLVLETGLEEE